MFLLLGLKVKSKFSKSSILRLHLTDKITKSSILSLHLTDKITKSSILRLHLTDKITKNIYCFKTYTIHIGQRFGTFFLNLLK